MADGFDRLLVSIGLSCPGQINEPKFMSEIVDQFRSRIEQPKPQASWLREAFYSFLAFLLTFAVITIVVEQLGLGDLGLSGTLYRGYRTAASIIIPNDYVQEARRRAADAAQAAEDAKLDGKWFAPVQEDAPREPLTFAEMAFPAIIVIAFGYVAFSLFFRDSQHKIDTGTSGYRHGGGMAAASKAARSSKPEAISSGTAHSNRKGGAVEKPAGEDRLTALMRRRRQDRNRPAA